MSQTVHLTEDEVSLLAYLHEHAPGIGELFALPPKKVADALAFDLDRLAKTGSYVAQIGFVNVKAITFVNSLTVDNPPREMMGIWITGAGEQFMRAVQVEIAKQSESNPAMSRFKRLSVAAVREGYAVIKAIVIAVAVQHVQHHH